MAGTLSPRLEEGQAMLLVGIRREHTFADAPRQIPSQWDAFMRRRPIDGEVEGVTYGAMCATFLARQAFEYMTAVEVASFDGVPIDLGRMRVPSALYLVFEHTGHVTGIQSTWADVHRYLPSCGYRLANTPDFERYDARYDAATGTGVVEIWVPVVVPGE
jgi:predicted transcriptional regulator YdeE